MVAAFRLVLPVWWPLFSLAYPLGGPHEVMYSFVDLSRRASVGDREDSS